MDEEAGLAGGSSLESFVAADGFDSAASAGGVGFFWASLGEGDLPMRELILAVTESRSSAGFFSASDMVVEWQWSDVDE